MASPDADAAPGLPALDDDGWEDLLNYIEKKRVTPIVGPELLRVETDAGPRLLYDWLAEKLAAKLSVDLRQLPQPCTLNDVVCWYLAARGRREEANTRLSSILRETNFTVRSGKTPGARAYTLLAPPAPLRGQLGKWPPSGV